MLIFKLFSKDLLDEKGVAFWALKALISKVLAYMNTIPPP